MGRLDKLKRQAINEANRRVLGEQHDEWEHHRKQAWELNDKGDIDGDDIADRLYLDDDNVDYIGTFGPDDNTLPWMNKKNRRNPSIEDYEDDEETFDTFDDWRGSSYYNDPESRWDINRGGYDDTNKHYFDIHREKFGPFRIRKSIS